jgi:hypothetical protein
VVKREFLEFFEDIKIIPLSYFDSLKNKIEMNSFIGLWFIVVILIVNTSQKAYDLDERDIEDTYSLLPRLLFDVKHLENDDVDNIVKR